MFRRFIRWLFDIQDPPPEPLPDEPWERMFELAKRFEELVYGELTINHLDVAPPMYSDTLTQLFERLEFLILNVTDEEAILPGWKDRRREVLRVRMPDYLYSHKFGYRAIESVVRLLTEKIVIIHNLFEKEQLDEQHVLYPYLRREFTPVVKDTCTVLEFCLTLAVSK